MNDPRTPKPGLRPQTAHSFGTMVGLCSRCNTKRPLAGGGTVNGRWYGQCCKPAKKVAK